MVNAILQEAGRSSAPYQWIVVEGLSKLQIPLIEDCRLKIEDLRSASGGINY
jgi:hypothetical protein